jgi:hypothetical protein
MADIGTPSDIVNLVHKLSPRSAPGSPLYVNTPNGSGVVIPNQNSSRLSPSASAVLGVKSPQYVSLTNNSASNESLMTLPNSQSIQSLNTPSRLSGTVPLVQNNESSRTFQPTTSRSAPGRININRPTSYSSSPVRITPTPLKSGGNSSRSSRSNYTPTRITPVSLQSVNNTQNSSYYTNQSMDNSQPEEEYDNQIPTVVYDDAETSSSNSSPVRILTPNEYNTSVRNPSPLPVRINTPVQSPVRNPSPLPVRINTPVQSPVRNPSPLPVRINTPVQSPVRNPSPLPVRINTPVQSSPNQNEGSTRNNSSASIRNPSPLPVRINTPVQSSPRTPVPEPIPVRINTPVQSPLRTPVPEPIPVRINTPNSTMSRNNSPPQPTSIRINTPGQPTPIRNGSPPQPTPIRNGSPPQPTPIRINTPGQPTPIRNGSPGQPTPIRINTPGQPTPIRNGSPPQPTPIRINTPGQQTPIRNGSPPQPTPIRINTPGQATPMNTFNSEVQNDMSYPQAVPSNTPVDGQFTPIRSAKSPLTPVNISPTKYSNQSSGNIRTAPTPIPISRTPDTVISSGRSTVITPDGNVPLVASPGSVSVIGSPAYQKSGIDDLTDFLQAHHYVPIKYTGTDNNTLQYVKAYSPMGPACYIAVDINGEATIANTDMKIFIVSKDKVLARASEINAAADMVSPNMGVAIECRGGICTVTTGPTGEKVRTNYVTSSTMTAEDVRYDEGEALSFPIVYASAIQVDGLKMAQAIYDASIRLRADSLAVQIESLNEMVSQLNMCATAINRFRDALKRDVSTSGDSLLSVNVSALLRQREQLLDNNRTYPVLQSGAETDFHARNLAIKSTETWLDRFDDMSHKHLNLSDSLTSNIDITKQLQMRVYDHMAHLFLSAFTVADRQVSTGFFRPSIWGLPESAAGINDFTKLTTEEWDLITAGNTTEALLAQAIRRAIVGNV